MPDHPTTPPSTASLPRRLGAWSALGAMIGTIIGSGIFRVPSGVATYLPTPSAFPLVWVAGGLFALAGALIYAEYAAMFPVSGGRYLYLREGIGRMPAFVYAWTSTILLQPVSIGAVALVFAAYLSTLIPALATREREIALLLLLLIGAVNYRSAIFGARLTVITSAAKLLTVTALAIVLLLAVSPSPAPPDLALSGFSWHGFGLALIIVMWTYSGWDTPTLITGEVRDPGRIMPRVLIGGMLLMIVLFVLVNLAYLQALSIPEIAASSAVAADAVGRQFGSTGMHLVALMVALSTLGTLCAAVLTVPRLVFALGGGHPSPWASRPSARRSWNAAYRGRRHDSSQHRVRLEPQF